MYVYTVSYHLSLIHSYSHSLDPLAIRCKIFHFKMAASNEKEGYLTSKQIVCLATAISADNMTAIVEGYMDISDETIKNKKYENKDDAEAFNREILKYWINKNSGPNQIMVWKLNSYFATNLIVFDYGILCENTK